MKLKFIFFLLLLPFFNYADLPKKSITFGGGDRLGDNLVDYMHAKWLSYKYNIPLLLKPFKYADQLVLSDVEETLDFRPSIDPSHWDIHEIISLSELEEEVTRDTLYYVLHVCDAYEEYVFLGCYNTFVPIDWNDKVFRKIIRKLIAPKQKLNNLILPPKNKISVALHYRTGGDYAVDVPFKTSLPLRFPNMQFYIEQIQKLFELVSYQPLHIHIFTDDSNPGNLCKGLQAVFANYPQITFSYRDTGNSHSTNVLEDLFSMAKFDCLIRPMSHFSMTASHIGNFKIEIYPANGYWNDQLFMISQVKILQNAIWDPISHQWIKVKK